MADPNTAGAVPDAVRVARRRGLHSRRLQHRGQGHNGRRGRGQWHALVIVGRMAGAADQWHALVIGSYGRYRRSVVRSSFNWYVQHSRPVAGSN